MAALMSLCIQRAVQMVGIGLEELFNARSIHLENYAIMKFMLPSRIAQCIQEEITGVISASPALTPSDIAWGKGLGFVPSTCWGKREEKGPGFHCLHMHEFTYGIPPALQTIDLSVTLMISKRILNISEYNYYAILKQKWSAIVKFACGHLLIYWLFDKCKSICGDFKLGEMLLDVVTDWYDAEINGERMAVGK